MILKVFVKKITSITFHKPSKKSRQKTDKSEMPFHFIPQVE